jgi:delta8-fatty-acid desaturase
MHLHFYEVFSSLFVLPYRQPFQIYRRRAVIEQITLATHWALVIVQLYLLPSFQIRLMYFVVSQLFSGWLTAHVVTYNHYSTDKFPRMLLLINAEILRFPDETEILDNYPCLQLYTTRNMRPGFFIDWLWGGLNYQVEPQAVSLIHLI